jgi:hypothetical protein|nr:MAG TPA: DNA-directed RNA polymerase II subunit [Caudoviricetes sp.]
MSTTIGCPIPGASQPKEPVRLIDIKEVLQYDGAHFTWSGGKNCLSEQKAAYARGYDAGMKFIVDEAKKAPTIDPESLRPTAHWKRIQDVAYMCTYCKSCFAFIPYNYQYCPECGAKMLNAYAFARER